MKLTTAAPNKMRTKVSSNCFKISIHNDVAVWIGTHEPNPIAFEESDPNQSIDVGGDLYV
jgi:hypothetical protein